MKFKNLYITGAFMVLPTLYAVAQHTSDQDSLHAQALKEVVILSSSTTKVVDKKPLLSVDEMLSSKDHVSLIRRGAYAWEPMINNMAIERTRQTIDGMQMFYACTDKMDPITSYVEMNNLESVEVTSGAQGSHFGPTLGGSIDLKTKKLSFTEDNLFNAQIQSGYESVNQQKIAGGNFNFTSKKFYTSGSIMFRDAENYKAGGGEEILYSQYRKLNASGSIGYALSKQHTLEAAIIYDKATDIGYPALPMDVSLAEAVITSLKYTHKPVSAWVSKWETKLYYNAITHRMDDSKRPEVAIRMDMPGWTKTLGAYSTIENSSSANHYLTATLNAYRNTSLAEMTMLSSIPGGLDMFAYTWPDVKTTYVGVALKDQWKLANNQSLVLSGTLGSNTHETNQYGKNQLGIFHNDNSIEMTKTRAVGNLAVNYERTRDNWVYGIGIGYGHRAPSVSEGYGYYLFNSGDKYDYIGNPNLKNESSYEGNFLVHYYTPTFSSKLSGSIFYLTDYIIGVITPPFNAMTAGGLGVKVYNNLDSAVQASVNWNFTYAVHPNWKVSGGASYNYGKDSNQNTLPFISPIAYNGTLTYKYNQLSTQLSVNGNAVKNKAAEVYGETTTPAYAILNWQANYQFPLQKNTLGVGLGVSNLLDTYYTTYADWNKVPNLGRNIFVNITYKL